MEFSHKIKHHIHTATILMLCVRCRWSFQCNVNIIQQVEQLFTIMQLIQYLKPYAWYKNPHDCSIVYIS